jgi:DNA-binding response OmpR family regulator
MQNHILIIDDDVELCELQQRCLENEFIDADIIHNGKEGLALALSSNIYQLIVLDVMLPEMNGFDVLTELRKSNAVPVLMLTAKDSEVDKVSGLRLGADDYLTKPFNLNEFIARVQSLIRRYTTLNSFNQQPSTIIRFKGITIDKENRTVIISGEKVDLTSKEFDLLYLMASNQGKVFTKKQIYSQVWDNEYAYDDGNIMAYISKLRKKIEPDINNPIYLQTVWGVGYSFNEDV